MNHDLHWFTLRRFGQSADRWYNLNSMAEDTPKWIGPTFLSMAIAQAEAEGYSIFTVLPVQPSSDPSGHQPGNLIACQADEHALLFDQLAYSSTDRSSSDGSPTLRRPREENAEQTSRTRMRMNEEGDVLDDLSFEDQLRLAIAASLDESPADGKEQATSARQTIEQNTDEHRAEFPSSLDSSSQQVFASKKSANTEGDTDLPSDLHSIEEKELAAAISESLLDQSVLQNDSDLKESSNPVALEDVDEPTPEELRQRRLARFS